MMEPHAEQIFNLDEDKKLTLDSETLRRILICDELKDKNVCVVSIAGAFRQGKSFLLNFLIRYLNIRYKEKRDVTKWLDSADGPLLGFSWATGSLRHTVGILMWSEVFLAQLPTGGEMAIILLDTQGSFDNSTTITECATIFALSTLISSIQIYNLKENIKQCDLSHLEFFTKYGQMILDNSEYSGPPFQNLLFLVRDWQWPHEREFGIKGGKQLLNHVLNTDDNDLNSEIMEQRKNIKNVFEKINCCLLPHPGTQVATDPKFQGELQDVDHKFLENIEMLIPHVLAPEQLIPKTVSGENIKIVDLVSIIESYWECFQNGEMPPLATLLEVTTLQHHMISKREAEKIYENSMKFLKDENDEFLNNEELITLHNQNKQRAIEFYSKKKKMGDPSISKRYEEELEMTLNNKFSEYETINDLKRKNQAGFFSWVRYMFTNKPLKTSIYAITTTATASAAAYVGSTNAVVTVGAFGLEALATGAVYGTFGAGAGLVLAPVALFGMAVIGWRFWSNKRRERSSDTSSTALEAQ